MTRYRSFLWAVAWFAGPEESGATGTEYVCPRGAGASVPWGVNDGGKSLSGLLVMVDLGGLNVFRPDIPRQA